MMLATSSPARSATTHQEPDLVRRNAWAQAGSKPFVANAVGTGIKPQKPVG